MAPPLEPGAVKATVAVVDPVAVAVPIVGAPATVRGVTAAETIEVAPVPAALVALTRNVYDVPFVKPVTVVTVPPKTKSVVPIVVLLFASCALVIPAVVDKLADVIPVVATVIPPEVFVIVIPAPGVKVALFCQQLDNVVLNFDCLQFAYLSQPLD